MRKIVTALMLLMAVGARANTEEVVRGDTIYTHTMPRFKGGDGNTAFRKWVAKQIKYPRAAVLDNAQGQAVVRFIINKKGKVTDIEMLGSPHPSIAEEAMRVVGRSPRWKPGKQGARLKNGKVVQKTERVEARMTVPIIFSLDNTIRWNTDGVLDRDAVKTPPRFGGEADPGVFARYVVERVKMPDDMKEKGFGGPFTMRFVVTPNGSLSDIMFRNSPGDSLTDEIMRVIKGSPRWEPGMNKGKRAAVRIMVTLNFPEAQ